MNAPLTFGVLEGKTLSSIDNFNNEEIIFTTTDGQQYKLHHHQDCCENVQVEDIVGDLDDLVGSKILQAEEVSGETGEDSEFESYTWTFYKLATNKGSVTLRWLGTSNGYCSESVDFDQLI